MNVADKVEIHDLITAYSFGYDELNWALFDSVWSDDAVLVMADGEALTRDEIVNGVKDWREHLAADGIQIRHYQTNALLEFTGNETATGRVLLSVAWQRQGERAPSLVHTGVYVDRYVRISERWRIARREIHLDHEVQRLPRRGRYIGGNSGPSGIGFTVRFGEIRAAVSSVD